MRRETRKTAKCWASHPFGPRSGLCPSGSHPSASHPKGAQPSGNHTFWAPPLSRILFVMGFRRFSFNCFRCFPSFFMCFYVVILCFFCFLSAQIDQILVAKIGLAKVGRGPLGPCTRETLFARYGVVKKFNPKVGIWILGFRFQVLRFRIQVLGSRFWV